MYSYLRSNVVSKEFQLNLFNSSMLRLFFWMKIMSYITVVSSNQWCGLMVNEVGGEPQCLKFKSQKKEIEAVEDYFLLNL